MTNVERPIVTVAITGASGAVIGIRILELIRETELYELHLIVSSAGAMTITAETDYTVREVEALADVVHKAKHIGASIASGSSPVTAMFVAPCSIHTLSAIAYGITDELISRAADVCLKEGRPLILMVRETPLHVGHLGTMERAAQSGAVILPPEPAFYHRLESIEQMVDYMARGAIQRAGIPEVGRVRWEGIPRDGTP